MSLAGQVRGANISPVKWPKDNVGGSFKDADARPFAAHYTDPDQPIRVYFNLAEDVENLRSLMQATKTIIGGTSIYVKLTPTRMRARSEFETRGANLIYIDSTALFKQQRRWPCRAK